MNRILLPVILIVLLASCGEGSRKKGGASPAGTDATEVADNAITKTRGGTSAANRAGTDSSITLNPGAGTDSNTALNPGAGTDSNTALNPGAGNELPAGAVLIARDIVTEVIIRPDPEGDPWEVEKVAGYNGGSLVDGIFSNIYDGTMTVYDYHNGEPLKPADVKKIEGEFKNDRSKIGKISFTEDWYYFPEENRVEKRTKSVTFGYELYNNVGKVYAYRAAFRADLN